MMNENDSDRMVTLAYARRKAWQPFVLIGLLVALIALLTALLAVEHVAVVANTLLVVLCLIPIMLLMLPLLVGVIVGIWGLSRADRAAVERLIKAEQAASDVRLRVQSGSKAVGSRFVYFAAAIERLEPLWRVFETEEWAKGRSDAAQSRQSEQSTNT